MSELRNAWNDLAASLIAVAPHLNKPYPDDPRWTPWTRFVESDLDRMDDAVKAALVMRAPADAAEARAAALQEALGAYRSALRSGEPETDQLRTLGDVALAASSPAAGWASVCPACKGYPDQAHTCDLAAAEPETR
jgi:hypothetical protein